MNIGRAAATPAVPAPSAPAGTSPASVPGPGEPPAAEHASSARGSRGLAGRAARLAAFASRTHAPYQAAAFRIGIGFVVAAFLVREWPHRRVLYGDRSPWALDMAGRLLAETGGFTVLTWWSGRWWFELVYHGTVAVAVLLMLGWRTRATSVLLMVGVLSLVNRNTQVTDGGDNILQVMVIYLVFTRCARVWSLDARRNRRLGDDPGRDRAGFLMWQAVGLALLWVLGFSATGWNAVLWGLWAVHGLWWLACRRFPRHRARALLDDTAAMLHNCAMLVIAVQVCLIYATAGWYKIQGSRWQDGTALHYPLHLPEFSPWPWLAGLLAANMVVVLALTYGTVILQVAFPFVVLNRKVKNVLIPVMMLEHLGIAVVLGIPFLSLAAIVCDAVFLPTAFLLLLGDRCTDAARRMRERVRGAVRTSPPEKGVVVPS
ncbi:HTTM domain-containing protein [Streptomyces thermolineatus]|uniref:HTTM domain-containing protein n=1 Tax=Streptomyces thermolineatus TaxID=44033 RepID=UPI0038512940